MIHTVFVFYLSIISILPPDLEPQALETPIVTGAEQISEYLNLLENKSVGLAVNHTSMVGTKHLVDTLLTLEVDIKKIFAPEHGFRGEVQGGEKITNSIDPRTKLPIISLYGANRKPTPDQLHGLDVIIFDIQDVGVRFYTYISTMHNIMEACAENDVSMIILDRPNPNGDYVDGPILEGAQESFIGLHPIPIVHGLTIGELAMMINGEGWLGNGVQCELQVIKVKNYHHSILYQPPVAPSPNLPNFQSIRLYPFLGLFEGTRISVGRGTNSPFQIVGYPDPKFGGYQFTPRSKEGMSTEPKHQDKLCYGLDLSKITPPKKLDLQYLITYYQKSDFKDEFFEGYYHPGTGRFDRLAGNTALREQIKQGLTEEQIRNSWAADLKAYRALRKQYLLYKDNSK